MLGAGCVGLQCFERVFYKVVEADLYDLEVCLVLVCLLVT